MKWSNSVSGTPVLYSESGEILAVLNPTAWSCVNGDSVPKYGLTTQNYMSQWEGIVFENLEEAKREVKRVLIEKRMLFEDVMYEAKEQSDGKLVFLSQNVALHR